MDNQVIKTDVLVIGAGIAGITAAIEAKDRGADVVLTTKGLLGRDGAATWMAGYGCQAALQPPDTPEIHAQDTIRAGRFLNDQELVYKLTREIPALVKRMNQWGIRYRKVDGKLVMMRLPGETYPRVPALERPAEYAGHEYRKVFPKQVRKRDINVLEDFQVIDLLTNKGSVVGAVGFDLREGDIKVINAKLTIMATGGHMGVYKVTTSPCATGDGSAMGYRAGVRMADMEFADFYSYTAIWPPITTGEIWPTAFRYELNAILYNKVGEDFMRRYTGPRRVPPLAIQREVKEGRGSPHGGAYLSLRHLPTNLIRDFLTPMGPVKWLDKLKSIGFDITNDAVEVAPAGLCSFGGCDINVNCETSIPGLYAAGEVASRREGAYTNAGNSIPLCLALGYVAGVEAGKKFADTQLLPVEEQQVADVRTNIFGVMEREKGLSPIQVKQEVQNVLGEYGSLVGRTDERLKKGLSEIERVRKESLPRVSVSAKDRRYNLEWADALTARNMTDVVELILRAALTRTESRGLHFREDYPEEHPEWLKRIMLQKKDSKIEVSTEPVTFPYFKPEEKKTKDGR